MKIVLVHNSYQRPGGEDLVYQQERDLLKRAGHQVLEYHRSNHEVSQNSFLDQLALAKRTIWASDTRREFRELLLREKPHVVHVHNTFVMISPSVYWACHDARSEEHTSELQSPMYLVCRLLLEKKKKKNTYTIHQ